MIGSVWNWLKLCPIEEFDISGCYKCLVLVGFGFLREVPPECE
jgi:hypothetical protein